MTNLALFNFRPSHCPECGNKLIPNSSDYAAKASHYCPKCNLIYQLAETDKIIQAAELSGGDLAQYV